MLQQIQYNIEQRNIDNDYIDLMVIIEIITFVAIFA